MRQRSVSAQQVSEIEKVLDDYANEQIDECVTIARIAKAIKYGALVENPTTPPPYDEFTKVRNGRSA